MRVQVAIPEAHVTAPVLDAALEATTRVNESLIHSGELDPFDPEHPGVRWKPEPPGQEHFDHGRLVQGRGHGDCDDLAPWHAASLRATGEDPGAKAFVRKSGEKRWHALVRRSDGSVDDPSLDAGMPGPGRRGVLGAWTPVMGRHVHGVGSVGAYERRPQLALRPVGLRSHGGEREAWQARTDLPWHTRKVTPSPSDIAMVSLHASPVSDQALVGAVDGAILLGECNGASEEHLDRLRAIADMIDGADWEDVAADWGPEHADAAGQIVGSWFGRRLRGISRGAKRVARSKAFRWAAPLAAAAIPGIGPAAAAALAASLALRNKLKKARHVRPEQRPRVLAVPEVPPEVLARYAEQYAAPQYPPGYPPGYAATQYPPEPYGAQWGY